MKRLWIVLFVAVVLGSLQLGAAITPATTSTWTQPSSGCASPLSCTYNLYRGPAVGTETLLKSGINALQYIDATVVRGSKYCYKISATNQYGEGALSGEHCITIPNVPTPPGNFKVTSN